MYATEHAIDLLKYSINNGKYKRNIFSRKRQNNNTEKDINTILHRDIYIYIERESARTFLGTKSIDGFSTVES